jgi:hypothetical protein
VYSVEDKVLVAVVETAHEHYEPGFYICGLKYDGFIFDEEFEI